MASERSIIDVLADALEEEATANLDDSWRDAAGRMLEALMAEGYVVVESPAPPAARAQADDVEDLRRRLEVLERLNGFGGRPIEDPPVFTGEEVGHLERLNRRLEAVEDFLVEATAASYPATQRFTKEATDGR